MSSSDKMTWRQAKELYLSMPNIIKRTEYKCGDKFKTVNDVIDWGAYVRTDEAIPRLAKYFAEKDAQSKNKKTQTDASATKKKDALDEKKSTNEDKGVDKLLASADSEKIEVKRTSESKAGDKSTADEVPAKIVKSMRETPSTDESSGSGECKAGDRSNTTKESAKMEMESIRETASPDGSSESESTTTEDTVKTEVEVKNERISTLSKATDKSTTTEDDAKMASAGEGEAVVAAQPITEKKFTKNDVLNGKISLFIGDITCLEIDAIVNAANTELFCGGGVDEAIHVAAGYKHLRGECAELKQCKTGNAKITGGYKLPAKYIIHAVGPMGEFPDELRSSYKKSMDLLKEHELETIAFPCISTGIYKYDNENAAKVALETIRNWLDEDEYGAKVKRVIFCLFLPRDIDIYHKLMPKYFPFE